MSPALSLLVAVWMIPDAAVSDPGGTPSPAVLPAAQAEAIQRDLRALAQAVGIAPAPAVVGTPEKTMVDVADKALDLASGAVARMAEGLQKIAPEIMRIMVRQQYARAIGDLIAPVFCFIMLLIGALVASNKAQKLRHADAAAKRISEEAAGLIFVSVVLWIGVIITMFVTSSNLGDAVKRLINPEFYAIRDLVLVLLGRGEG